ncbi:MAG TPA: hypothetical protein DHW52_01855, partial [Alcanivorax sp.]|nr:hypothetical protein [Alcanivorax sp.]
EIHQTDAIIDSQDIMSQFVSEAKAQEVVANISGKLRKIQIEKDKQKEKEIEELKKKLAEAEKKGEPLKDPLWKPDDPMDLNEEAPLAVKLPYIVIVIDEFADMMMIV